MGIPKFFRWMSERYPLCSQLIESNRIPAFDNLYLDMNGIIHACSHPNDGDAHFRITEEQIFLNIFNYIDALFNRIKPQKLFFMAVDGVAPRAKMNQQRARRFRSAKDAEDLRRKAEAKGEVLPEGDAFDSNCITPGTDFMTKLSTQLKYFVSKKVNEDSSWRGVEIVLSGHDVPGEGEHKIMEYLRLARSRPEWDPNTRHCLYGLDADLIMLGLLSHEPHFALLREEVTFGRGKKKTSATANPDTQNFYLMHLSLLREYLDKEFHSLKTTLPFEYNLERVIDDFILMAYFVGNDFLPHLPSLHINEGALSLLFSLYKKVLPKQDGYLNEHGVMNLKRCQAFMEELASFEYETFESTTRIDKDWMNNKGDHRGSHGHQRDPELSMYANQCFLTPMLVMTEKQHHLYQTVRQFVLQRNVQDRLYLPKVSAKDRAFVLQLARELGVRHGLDVPAESGDTTEKGKRLYLDWDTSDDETDEESDAARRRVLRKYEKATIVSETMQAEEAAAAEERRIKLEFEDYRREYYREKMGIDFDDPEAMKKLVYEYVEGLQWVLYYYYNGVMSWGWFYPHHYAPRIADLKGIVNFKFNFDMGVPFHPFEQLMGVLPAGSLTLVPPAFRELMTDPTSPIIDFYPKDFELDMNGKKADWEAIVKIPFIDQHRLLAAMKNREGNLSSEEKARNSFGPSWRFVWSDVPQGTYPSPMPDIFPDIVGSHCVVEPYHLPVLELGQGFTRGLLPGAKLGVHSRPGFPTMMSIPHSSHIGVHGVNVFNVDSKSETVVVRLEHMAPEGKSPEDVALDLVGKRVFIQWPFLMEAVVYSVSDEMFLYTVKPSANRRDVIKTPHSVDAKAFFAKSADKLEYEYSKRYGVEIGPVEYVVQVRPLVGMKLFDDGSRKKDYADVTQLKDVAWQTVVTKVEEADPRFLEHGPVSVEVEFPPGSRVFFLGKTNYGSVGEVTGHQGQTLTLKLYVPRSNDMVEPNFGHDIAQKATTEEKFQPAWALAKAVDISPLSLSKVTSSLHVISKDSEQKTNIGLNLKFESKKRKVLGYSQKSDRGWEYSTKTLALLKEYKEKFPEIFRTLEKKAGGQGEFFEDTDFFKQDAAKRVAEVASWLKQKGVKEFDQVPLETESLTKEYAGMIEKAIDGWLEDNKSGEAFKLITVKNIPRMAVLKPTHAKERLGNQKFRLGDRVVFAEDTGGVPMGLKGTVIGLTGNVVDVVFDKTFMNGNSLGGRCSPLRGMTVWAYSLMNLSRIQPPISHAATSVAIAESSRDNAFKALARPEGGVVAAAKMVKTREPAPRPQTRPPPRPHHGSAPPRPHHGTPMPYPPFVPMPPEAYAAQFRPVPPVQHVPRPQVPSQPRPPQHAPRPQQPRPPRPQQPQQQSQPRPKVNGHRPPKAMLDRPVVQRKELSEDVKNLLGVKDTKEKEVQQADVDAAANALKSMLKIDSNQEANQETKPQDTLQSPTNRGRGGYRGRGRGRGNAGGQILPY